jgi:hypothetical protein
MPRYEIAYETWAGEFGFHHVNAENSDDLNEQIGSLDVQAGLIGIAKVAEAVLEAE